MIYKINNPNPEIKDGAVLMVKCFSFCCHSFALCLHPAMMKFKFGGVMQPTNLILYGPNMCHHDIQLDTAVSFVCMSPALLV